MFKVIVAGSRQFTNYPLIEKKLDFLLQNLEEIEIVSGMAPGTDSLGIRYAKKRNLPYKTFPAEWSIHGRKAGYLRNASMAKYADALVAFWDGTSPGTLHMIELFLREKKPIRVLKIHPHDHTQNQKALNGDQAYVK